MDENFDKLIKWLLFGTVDFDFISEALLPDLNKGTQDGRTLTVGCMHYDQILVPNCKTLRSTTLGNFGEISGSRRNPFFLPVKFLPSKMPFPPNEAENWLKNVPGFPLEKCAS